MSVIQFPGYYEAPRALFDLDGNCGPISVWMLLRYFRKRTSAGRIIRLCRYTKRHGTFTIGLAVALREHGLHVSLHTEEDPAPMQLERQMYRRAQKLGVAVDDAIDVDELLDRVHDGAIAIVCFNTDEGNGHFSPIIGVEKGHLVLPYTDQGRMKVDEFVKRWTPPSICKQCLLATS